MAFTHRQYDVTNPYHKDHNRSGFRHVQHDADHPNYKPASEERCPVCGARVLFNECKDCPGKRKK